MRDGLLRWRARVRVSRKMMQGSQFWLPATVGAPFLVKRLDPRQLLGGQVAVDRLDVGLELLDRAGAGNDAVHPGLGQQPAQRCLSERLPASLQEPELFDPLEPQLEAVTGWAAPLLVGWDRLAGHELAGQQAARQRRADHDADVLLLGQWEQLVLGRRVQQVVLDLEEVRAELDRLDAGGVV